MELHQLQCFVIVVDCKSFSRAAERLGIVQSAVSQKVKVLEEQLNVELFDRSRQQVELTEVGRRFLPEARRVLLQAERAAQIAKDASAGKVGRISIGFVDNALWSVLPSIFWLFHSRYPAVELSLHQLGRLAQLAALEDKTIDIGIFPPRSRDTFEKASFIKAPFVVALPAHHRMAGEEKLHLVDLANDPFVLFPGTLQTRMGEQILEACATAGFKPKAIQEAQPLTTVLALVNAGVGVTLVPQWMSGIYTDSIAYRDLAEPTPDYELCLAWRGNSACDLIENFKSVVRDVVRSGGMERLDSDQYVSQND